MGGREVRQSRGRSVIRQVARTDVKGRKVASGHVEGPLGERTARRTQGRISRRVVGGVEFSSYPEWLGIEILGQHVGKEGTQDTV